MRIWLLRHGHAEPYALSDALRGLTVQGRQQVLHSAAQLIGRPLQAILSSPYVRARQTAGLVVEALQSSLTVEVVPWLTPESSISSALAYLAARTETEILLVSHQPFIGELAGMLEHGHRQQALPMATGSLAELESEIVLSGAMQLVSLFHPHK